MRSAWISGAEGTAATGDQTSGGGTPSSADSSLSSSILRRDCRRPSYHRLLRRRRTALRVAHGPLEIVYLAGVILTAIRLLLRIARQTPRPYERETPRSSRNSNADADSKLIGRSVSSTKSVDPPTRNETYQMSTVQRGVVSMSAAIGRLAIAALAVAPVRALVPSCVG